MTTSQEDPPAYLPPRRPRSMTDVQTKRLSQPQTPPYLSPQRPVSVASAPQVSAASLSAPSLASSSACTVTEAQATAGARDGQPSTSDQTQDNENMIDPAPSKPQSSSMIRHSSLRFDGPHGKAKQPRSVANSIAESIYEGPGTTPRSLPPSRAGSLYCGESLPADAIPLPAIPSHMQEDSWRPPPFQQPNSVSRSSSQRSTTLGPKPRASFSRLSSLDQLISYREEKAEWKRASSVLQSAVSDLEDGYFGGTPTVVSEPETCHDAVDEKHMHTEVMVDSGFGTPDSTTPPPSVLYGQQTQPTEQPKNRFRHLAAEVGFTYTIAMTQFLAEYMISGFAIELPKIINRSRNANSNDMGMFWPASLLSLILSASLLIFARISDMYGGYFPFMAGVIWLSIWSLVAGFAGIGVVMDVARAMQGLAIAAFIPSTFAMVGSIYPEGPRKNLVLGLYSGCAPLGFFAGFLVAGSLSDGASGWYFWIATALSCVTAITAYLTVPHDRTDRKQLGLKMDWIGSILITGGLILISYALAVEPYANQSDPSRTGWSFPMILGPLISGIVCLALAFWVEGWYASCPLLPFDFFTPKSIKAFSLACLCFYASYGVWLYESAQFFESESATGVQGGVRGVTLAAWYTPTAVGGLVLCVAGGALLHIIPIMGLLLVSALAWIAAPLLLALCPLPVSYWAYVMPSMLCATLGIDLTFTVSVVFLSSVQPLRYQGLAGAVSSILVNLAMSFSLSISEIVAETAKGKIGIPDASSPGYQAAIFKQENWGFQAAFLYAAASAGLGLIISILFVRMSRSAVREQPSDEERPRASSEASTLVED